MIMIQAKSTRLVVVESEDGLQGDRNDEARDHGRDFAPGVDAPPIPAQQQHAAGSGAGDEQQFPRAGDGIEVERHHGRDDGEKHGGQLRCRDVVLLGFGLRFKKRR